MHKYGSTEAIFFPLSFHRLYRNSHQIAAAAAREDAFVKTLQILVSVVVAHTVSTIIAALLATCIVVATD